MAAEVYLKGSLENVVERPAAGFIKIEPSKKLIVDASSETIIAGGGNIALSEDGTFRQALPAAGSGDYSPDDFDYTATFVRTRPMREEIVLATFALLEADATSVTEDDGAGGTVTFYEKDISDFMT